MPICHLLHREDTKFCVEEHLINERLLNRDSITSDQNTVPSLFVRKWSTLNQTYWSPLLCMSFVLRYVQKMVSMYIPTFIYTKGLPLQCASCRAMNSLCIDRRCTNVFFGKIYMYSIREFIELMMFSHHDVFPVLRSQGNRNIIIWQASEKSVSSWLW